MDNQSNQAPKEISHNEAIKILVAAMGAIALGIIPGAWIKPGVEVGVLPIHAQSSIPV